MPILNGPLTFSKTEIPQQMKDWIHENGIKLPFTATKFQYSNRELDSWLRVNVGGKICKVDAMEVDEIGE